MAVTGMDHITKHLQVPSNPAKLLIGVISITIILGIITGYGLSVKAKGTKALPGSGSQTPKTAQQDNLTFRDFAEGIMVARPEPSDPAEYVEGTHVLQRQGAVPVALTSSVVDLSKYEGKKVKVFGETQKALKEGWLMDVGKVEVEN